MSIWVALHLLLHLHFPETNLALEGREDTMPLAGRNRYLVARIGNRSEDLERVVKKNSQVKTDFLAENVDTRS
jgi:hypothetical protein